MSLGEDENEPSLHEKLAVGTGIVTFIVIWTLYDLGTGVVSGIFSAILVEGVIELVVIIALYLKSDR